MTDVDWGELDYLVIDCPPGTSDEHLSIVTFLAGVPKTVGLIVTTPHELSLLDVRKEIGFCRKTAIKIIGVVENMSGYRCPNCNHTAQIFHGNTGGANKMCVDMDVPFLAAVPIEIGIGAAADQGRPVTSSDGITHSIFLDLVEKFEEHCKTNTP